MPVDVDRYTIKAIIFDFFDVIRSDPYNAWLSAHGFVREGAFMEASQELDSGRITLEEFLQVVTKLSGESLTLERFESDAKINVEVIGIIKELRKNFRIALLSNSPSELIRKMLQEHDLEKCFDEIIISSEVGYIKPSLESFKHTLKKLGIDASEAVFVDDNKQHIEGARKAGIKGIHFLSAVQLEDELRAAGLSPTGAQSCDVRVSSS